MRTIISLTLIIIHSVLFGQDTCKHYELKYENDLFEGQAKLVFEILDPSSNPFKSTIEININNYKFHSNGKDGILKVYLPIEKVKIKLHCYGIHDIVTDSIDLKSKTAYYFKIKLESETLKLPKIVYSYDKPVIYFYPEKETKITTKLDFNGVINFTYPESLNNKWEFTSNKEGQIFITNKRYRYIFWEGSNNIPFSEITNLEEGFIVNSDTIVQFIEKCLTKFAFNDQEIQDFITYWIPEIKKNKLNFIKFLEQEEYNNIAKLTIHPKPSSLIRVFMIWGKTDYKENIKTQVLPTKSRNGFTVVEWGGSNISSELKTDNIN